MASWCRPGHLPDPKDPYQNQPYKPLNPINFTTCPVRLGLHPVTARSPPPVQQLYNLHLGVDMMSIKVKLVPVLNPYKLKWHLWKILYKKKNELKTYIKRMNETKPTPNCSPPKKGLKNLIPKQPGCFMASLMKMWSPPFCKTASSGSLLIIAMVLLMDKILHHQGWWSHYL